MSQGSGNRRAAGWRQLVDPGTSRPSCTCRTAPVHDDKFKHHYDRLNYCITPGGFRVALFFICGVSYSGPYWQV